MNLYIYDSYLNKYKNKLNNIEAQLHNLNLNGRIVTLESVKNLQQIIKDEIINGVKTIVAVGNNETFNKVLNACLNSGEAAVFSNIALGIIPLGPNNSIAEASGIKNDKMAPDILLARRVEKINIGKANNTYFLSEASIQAQDTTLKIDSFSIDPIKNGEIRIINLLTERSSAQNIKSDPQDDLLDLYIYDNPKKPSSFSIKELTLENKSKKLLLDNAVEINTPALISQVDKKISLIIGKYRNF